MPSRPPLPPIKIIYYLTFITCSSSITRFIVLSHMYFLLHNVNPQGEKQEQESHLNLD